jgi:protein-disulfide isomerase
MSPIARLAAALLLGATAIAPALAQDFSAQQKQQIEGIVRDYLLTNPEILRDAYAALEAKQARAEAEQRSGALKTYADMLTKSPYQATVGNPNGKVTLVEFFDYNCGYCKQALPDLTRLMKEDGDLRVVLKDFPVLGPGSVEAAQVAIAVKKQLQGEKFWAFHVKLLGTRGQVGKAQALAAARDSGADMDKLAKDMEGPDIQATLQESAKLADALSLTGTPTYVVGDEVVVGAVGYAQIRGRLDNVRKCGKASCG